MLCAASTSLAKKLPAITSWDQKHFDDYAHYLDNRLLATYALDHLRHHMDSCKQDVRVHQIALQFTNELTYPPGSFLLEQWLAANLNECMGEVRVHGGLLSFTFRSHLLLAASRNGLPTAFELLLKTGVYVKTTDSKGKTPLLLAAIGGHASIVRLLLDAGEHPASSRDPCGRISLHWAARGGHIAVVKMLLDIPSLNANIADLDGRTALVWAAEGGHTAVVQLLLDREDVTVDKKDNFGLSALAWASRSGREEVVKLLVDRPSVEADSRDKNGLTPMAWPARNGYEAVVNLLAARVDVDAASEDANQRTPLSWATENGQLGLARSLPRARSAEEKDEDKCHDTTSGVEEADPGLKLTNMPRLKPVGNSNNSTCRSGSMTEPASVPTRTRFQFWKGIWLGG